MKFNIDSNIIKDTKKCRKEFSCLRNQGDALCRVVNCLNDEVHFVHYTINDLCGYKISFGFSYICSCPTRKEIFKHYRT